MDNTLLTKTIEINRLKVLHEATDFLNVVGTATRPIDSEVIVKVGQGSVLTKTTRHLRRLIEINRERERLIKEILEQAD